MKRGAALLALLVAMVPVAVQAAFVSHVLLVLNQGNEPIFSIRVGQALSNGTESWSGDMLPFNQAIEIGTGREFRFSFNPSVCTYDLQATYRDGHAIVLRRIDLCHTKRASFRH